MLEGVDDPGERGGTSLGEGDAAGGAPIAALVELDQHAHQLGQPIGRDHHVAGGVDAQREGGAGAALERAQVVAAALVEELQHQRQEIDARAVDLDAELEAEPARQLLVGLDAGEPAGAGGQDLERVVGVDLDLPALAAQARHGVGGEGAQRVGVGAGADHVVGVVIGQGRELVAAGELDGAEALEGAAGLRLGGGIAIDGAGAAGVGAEEALGGIGGAHAAFAILELQGDQRHEDFVAVAAAVGDEDVGGEQAGVGDERPGEAGREVIGSGRRGGGGGAGGADRMHGHRKL